MCVCFFVCFCFPGRPEAAALHGLQTGSDEEECSTPIHMQVGPLRGAPRESPQGHGQDFGRRPQAAWTVHCTTRRPRTLVPAPWGHADARRPCATNPGPSLVTPAPRSGARAHSRRVGRPDHSTRLTKPRQGEFKGIPGHRIFKLKLESPFGRLLADF